MSNASDDKDSNDYIDWLEKAITNEYLDSFEYSEFRNIQPIGNGSFGSVFRANWKNTDTIFALKFFNNQKSTIKEVVNELKLHRNVHFHANILKFCGITKTETNIISQMSNYILVSEYADCGTLKTYLDEHFKELEWDDKLHLASQLASAILWLHECDIIHRDLHENNILIHQKNIKLADFGLSKKIVEVSSNISEMFGVIPYMDPKSFDNIDNQSNHYKLNKKSDIYSIGVILWQISSGYRPFYAEGIKYDINLALAIKEGAREKIIDGTPIEYSTLYTKCWQYEPNDRPNIQEVVSTLNSITLAGNNIQVNDVNKEKENHSLIENSSNLNKKNSDLNSDLIINSIPIPESECTQKVYKCQNAAVNGNKVAQFNLGLGYQYGEGVEKDEVKAFEWHKKSAEQDDTKDNNFDNSHCNTRNNLPIHLNIPFVPASSRSSMTQQHQRLTTELVNSIGRTIPQPLEHDDFNNINVAAALNGGDSAEINSASLRELGKLGECAGGSVIKVENMVNGFIMAIKKINVYPVPVMHRKILRELQFLRTCHSPNVVSHYGAFIEDSDLTIAIIMEYCEGGSLDAIYKNLRKRQGRIGEVILGKIGESVLKGLIYLNSQQIIHGDIKPSNILVTKKGEIKISDFEFSSHLIAISVEGTFIGTSYYMAPERIKGLPYRVSADVWSLGLTIMEVAQNRFPFPSVLSPIELVSYIALLPAPTLSEEYEFSEELKDFLKFCLEKDGEKRPTPKQILNHPFIQLSAQRQVNLELWIKLVWEWDD